MHACTWACRVTVTVTHRTCAQALPEGCTHTSVTMPGGEEREGRSVGSPPLGSLAWTVIPSRTHRRTIRGGRSACGRSSCGSAHSASVGRRGPGGAARRIILRGTVPPCAADRNDRHTDIQTPWLAGWLAGVCMYYTHLDFEAQVGLGHAHSCAVMRMRRSAAVDRFVVD